VAVPTVNDVALTGPDAGNPWFRGPNQFGGYQLDARVATLYQAPYEQTVTIKDSKSLSYVRVVGTLDDGTVSEDLRYVNAPEFVSEVTVDAVELFTTVTDKGKPVNHLQASNFKVFEDGVIQKIQGFEYVKNLPISVGLVIDTSASMLDSLHDAEQAALNFLDYTIGMNVQGVGVDDPDVVLFETYSCGSERNYTGYCNADLEKLFHKQSMMTDVEQRRQLVWQIDKALQEDGARPVVYHSQAGTCWQPAVQGIKLAVNTIYNHWRFEDVWLNR